MGAEYYEKRTTVKAAALPKWFTEAKEQCFYDYGHAGYTGTFAETPGITVKDEEFPTVASARLWLEDNAQKWENALAVRVKDGGDGKPCWLVGAICSS